MEADQSGIDDKYKLKKTNDLGVMAKDLYNNNEPKAP